MINTFNDIIKFSIGESMVQVIPNIRHYSLGNLDFRNILAISLQV